MLKEDYNKLLKIKKISSPKFVDENNALFGVIYREPVAGVNR